MVLNSGVYEVLMRLVVNENEWQEFIKQNADMLRYYRYYSEAEFGILEEKVYIDMFNWCLDKYIYGYNKITINGPYNVTDVTLLTKACIEYMKKLLLGEIS